MAVCSLHTLLQLTAHDDVQSLQPGPLAGEPDELPHDEPHDVQDVPQLLVHVTQPLEQVV